MSGETLLPQFGMRKLVGLITLLAVGLGACVWLLPRQLSWTPLLAATLGTLATAMLLYVGTYCLAVLLCWRRMRRANLEQSPFASDAPPPQWVHPIDPE